MMSTSDNALQLVRDVLRRHESDEDSLADLRAPLAAWCSLARSECVAPERLLVELKHALDDSLASSRREPFRRRAITERVVRFAIESYYGNTGDRMR